MIATALGMLLGIVIVGMLPLSTGLVFACGMLMAGAALLASLHVFVVPRDELVVERLTTSQHELIQLQSQIPQGELELAEAKTSLDETKRQYLELAQRFESRRNQLLLFDWRTLRGIPFEKFLRAIFEELGYTVRLTKMSGDQGVDLVLQKDNLCIAVQAKGYAESVGNAAIQQAYAGMKYHRCNRCTVITNSCFTPSAVDLAARLGCVLIDGSQIHALILGEVQL